jgi:hypothetical protein
MKRRKLLDAAAILAALVGSAFGSSNLWGQEAAPERYVIEDSEVAPTSVTAAVGGGLSTASVSHPGHDEGSGASGCDSCAACDACDSCGSCFGPGMWYAELEGLGWWRKSRPLPSLVTTSPAGTAQATAGVLGAGTTTLLFGNDNFTNIELGGRITAGFFLCPDQSVGVAGSFFALGDDDVEFSRAAADANDILAIPFFDAAAGVEDALLINFPGVTTNGRVDVRAVNEVLGGDVYGRFLLYGEEGFRVDALGGYQFSRIDDSLRIHANYDDVAGLPNSNFDVTDLFDARNEFHGGTLGVLAEASTGRFVVKGMAKVGLGNIRQTVVINGQTVATPVGGGAPATAASGLFTQGTNIGTYENDEFGIVPEAKLNFGYRLTDNWTVSAGYSFIYWNDIVTAGRVIDRQVNPTQIPGPMVGPARPDFAFGDRNDFWVQGANLSLEFVY